MSGIIFTGTSAGGSGSGSSLPNGTLINGVCHIYQSAKPTTRPDGSSLVIGDLWYNTSTGVVGFWNGTYWLGKLQKIQWASTTNLSASVNMYFPLAERVVFERLRLFAWVTNQHDYYNNFFIIETFVAGFVPGYNQESPFTGEDSFFNMNSYDSLSTREFTTSNRQYTKVFEGSSSMDFTNTRGLRIRVRRLGSATAWLEYEIFYREVL